MIQVIVIKILVWYQKVCSPDTGILRFFYKSKNVCVFFPTCSEYTILAVKKYGVLKGLYLGLKRILRCYPWQKKHIDLLK